jgi:hypothetical protein
MLESEKRKVARMMFKTDAIIGEAVDRFSCEFPDWQRWVALELCLVGEAFVLKDDDGHGLLNPDQVEVIASPFLKEPPTYKMTFSERDRAMVLKLDPSFVIPESFTTEQVRHLFLKDHPYELRGSPPIDVHPDGHSTLKPKTFERVRELMKELCLST